MSQEASQGKSLTTTDSTGALRAFTSARIALGRAGGSLPTTAWLDFKASHAAARDAVHVALDVEAICSAIRSLPWEALPIESAAVDRRAYLLRPDLGRRLDGGSRARLV